MAHSIQPDCPACLGPGLSLGGFGRLHWFRCRDCGIDFSCTPSEIFNAVTGLHDAPSACIDYMTGHSSLKQPSDTRTD